MKNYLLIGLLWLSFIGFSQNDTPMPLEQFTRVNLGLHGLELTNELPISNSFVWENSIGIGMGSYVLSGANYTLILAEPAPYFTSELKFLYNRNKRFKKNRSALNNSGNYVGLQTKYSFGSDKTFELNHTLLTELHWGIQRPLGKRFIFDFHLGFGYLSDFDFNEGAVSPTLGLRFGYKLF
ncbi:MAG: hypothetical protein AB8B52_09285 [Winogradskyella sp.]|uniref:hypothetical protein n=1 Tax=Winogradskyella sp. TaxID=1883156 RepID=UPI00385F45F9